MGCTGRQLVEMVYRQGLLESVLRILSNEFDRLLRADSVHSRCESPPTSPDHNSEERKHKKKIQSCQAITSNRTSFLLGIQGRAVRGMDLEFTDRFPRFVKVAAFEIWLVQGRCADHCLREGVGSVWW